MDRLVNGTWGQKLTGNMHHGRERIDKGTRHRKSCPFVLLGIGVENLPLILYKLL
jgi:hypothetical protein